LVFLSFVNRKSAIENLKLLNDLIRPCQYVWRDRQTDLLGSFQVDNQLELRRLLNGNIGSLGTFKDLVHVCGGAPPQIREIRSIGHKSPGFQKFSLAVYRREPVLAHEFYDLCSL
jgi:hypothetical protein